ncbi:hypothetical protein QTO34_001374 [Cnephaeus nilssonii]|uniref:Uncharacterized protein n=1 Tax=Cnephaeus nilssonii TaxID=3371016 RepID=A0AA40HVQ3_CNENI|nr:hypothetical protein QTO34_001374 [Eptesicus nilssonii]
MPLQILIELETALLDDEPHWYKLQTHDESSLPLPQPSPFMPRRHVHGESSSKKLQRSQRISDSDISDYEVDDGIGVVPPGYRSSARESKSTTLTVPEQQRTTHHRSRSVSPHRGDDQGRPRSRLPNVPLQRSLDEIHPTRRSRSPTRHHDASRSPVDHRSRDVDMSFLCCPEQNEDEVQNAYILPGDDLLVPGFKSSMLLRRMTGTSQLLLTDKWLQEASTPENLKDLASKNRLGKALLLMQKGFSHHVFLEGDTQPQERLISQSLGENIPLARGRVSTLVSEPCVLSTTLGPGGSAPPSPLLTRSLFSVQLSIHVLPPGVGVDTPTRKSSPLSSCGYFLQQPEGQTAPTSASEKRQYRTSTGFLLAAGTQAFTLAAAFSLQ